MILGNQRTMDPSHSQGVWPLRITTAPRNTIESHEYLDRLKHRLRAHVIRHVIHSAKCVVCVAAICGVAPSAVGMKLEGDLQLGKPACSFRGELIFTSFHRHLASEFPSKILERHSTPSSSDHPNQIHPPTHTCQPTTAPPNQ